MTQSFAGLGVSPAIAAALSRRGITTPFEVQSLVLPTALAGRDVLAASPTGSGKTLAFGIPLIERMPERSNRPVALILVPTRELANQVADELRPLARARGCDVAAVYGGKALGSQAAAARRAAVIVATPGRLQDLIDRRMVDLTAVRTLVLDEADRMLDMGFQPQVVRILRDVPAERQTLLFSATLDGAVAELAKTYTKDPATFRTESNPGTTESLISHEWVAVTPDDRLERLVEHLDRADGLSLVFVRTKHGADKLARKLSRGHDLSVVALHGDMSQNQRESSLRKFESGHAPTLVATDVAARGLDVDDISHVINFDPPRTADDYTHRVGRTGRAGRTGTGVTFVLPEQRADVAALVRGLGGTHSAALAAAVPGAVVAAPAQRSTTPRRRRRR